MAVYDPATFKPNCRYGHGDLFQATTNGNHPSWGYTALHEQGALFSGKLFVCATCGYTELFDDEPRLTWAIENGEAQALITGLGEI